MVHFKASAPTDSRPSAVRLALPHVYHSGFQAQEPTGGQGVESTAFVQRHVAHRNVTIARASLDADGSPSIWPETQMDQNLAKESGQLRTSVRAQNDWLRDENKKLRATQGELRRNIFEMRRQDNDLRKEDTELRVEDARLRSAFALVSASLPAAKYKAEVFNSRVRHGARRTVVLGAVAVVFATIFCAYSVIRFSDSPADDGYGSDEDINALVDGEKRGRSCGWCPCACCCSLQICLFSFVMLVISAVAGSIMWQAGVIQPILAQVSMYIYVISLFVAFLAVIMWEFWSVLRDLIKYIIGEFRKVKGTLRPWGKRPDQKGDIKGSY